MIEVNERNEAKVQALVDALESIKRRCEAFANINLVGRSVNAKEGGTLRNVLQEALTALAAWEGQQ